MRKRGGFRAWSWRRGVSKIRCSAAVRSSPCTNRRWQRKRGSGRTPSSNACRSERRWNSSSANLQTRTGWRWLSGATSRSRHDRCYTASSRRGPPINVPSGSGRRAMLPKWRSTLSASATSRTTSLGSGVRSKTSGAACRSCWQTSRHAGTARPGVRNRSKRNSTSRSAERPRGGRKSSRLGDGPKAGRPSSGRTRSSCG
mmetsp:Transcript_90428/g.251354  ORF Transcript_90428/g.251354 Transcript_90428/m.251354 type:complete len:200 (-) Transcript_90428:66-665(-)